MTMPNLSSKQHFLNIGLDDKFVAKFGLYSFRVGADSAAHASGKLSKAEIQVIGCWNLSETPKTYNVAAEKDMCELSTVIVKGLF